MSACESYLHPDGCSVDHWNRGEGCHCDCHRMSTFCPLCRREVACDDMDTHDCDDCEAIDLADAAWDAVS